MEQIDLLANEEKDMEKIEYLRKEIERHNRLYYEQDEPEISDYEYDKLNVELRNLEAKYHKTNSELSKKIGGKTKDIFKPVKHDVQMQSLQDVFSFEEVENYLDKVFQEYGDQIEFCVENKIDGLSVSLDYVNGRLKMGSTRGDGFVGEDVTQNLTCIGVIPEFLTSKDTIEVRGEVFLPRKEFVRLNKELEFAGKKLLANPRNAAAGTLRQLDIDLVKSRNLSVFVFNVQKCSTRTFTTHHESLDYCKSIGLNVIEYSKVCKTKEQVFAAITEIGNERENFKYDIDGAVVKINNLSLREEMGSTVKVPKWAVAYKYPPMQKETKIIDVIVQVGRTGKVTPMATLEPVKVAGSTISSATLHNFDYIRNKDIRIGDRCIIQKAGDVIPEVDRVLVEKRTGQEKQVVEPVICPVCNERLEKEQDIVDIRCTNSECPALIYRSIAHFASRDCMDISGFGDAITEKLIESGKIADVADIYFLTYEDFLSLENFKDKSSNNLMKAIQETKNNSLDKLLFGLGIRNIGKKAAKVLSEGFSNIDEMIDASKEELEQLNDFGQIMATSVYEFFRKDKTKEIISKLKKAGVNMKSSKKEKLSLRLQGETVCITGSFDDYSREQLSEKIELHGGKISSSVSKKTSFVLAGENAGSKLNKANELGVIVYSLQEFLNKIEGA